MSRESPIKRSGMLVENLNSVPKGDQSGQLYLTLKRYHIYVYGIGSIISGYSGKEPFLVDQTNETGGN